MELMVGSYFCCAFAELAVTAENAPKPSSARRTPDRAIKRPIKMRGLRKADCETNFFFISGHAEPAPGNRTVGTLRGRDDVLRRHALPQIHATNLRSEERR